MTQRMVDMNCDMGESYGAWAMGDDDAIFPFVSSINVACGFHGGDPRVMERTVRAATEHGLGIGAHPGFPDLVGFGRRDISVTPLEARTDVLYQIGALAGFVRAVGGTLQHVKPHGQLNNRSVVERSLADAIVEAVRAFDPTLLLVAFGGELVRAAQEGGLRVAFEVFADRAYNADGTLVSRQKPGAVILDIDHAVERAVSMVRSGTVAAITGERITLPADTICIHGDTPGAATLARAVRNGLEADGVEVRPLAEVVKVRSAR